MLIHVQVPRVAQFSEKDRLHGDLIQRIQKDWACATHRGEHNNVGYCWRDPQTEQHYGLNNRRMATWAASIVRYHSCISMVVF